MDDKEKIKILEKENERLKRRLELRALSVEEMQTLKDGLNEAIEKTNQQRRELKEHADRYKELCNEVQTIKGEYEKSVRKIVREMKKKLR